MPDKVQTLIPQLSGFGPLWSFCGPFVQTFRLVQFERSCRQLLKAEFKAILKDKQKVAVDFTASWCGPCRQIGPIFDALEGTFGNIKFIKVDVDENSDTAGEEGISAMPTFKFYVSGKKVDELVGASKEKLEEKIAQLNAM